MPDQNYKELRTHIDGSDPFMTGGHQILKPRSDSKKSVPKWSRDDAKIKAILLSSFPKLETNPKQRAHAARWLRIIHLYFRVGLTRGQVAEELGITSSNVQALLRAISRAASGRRADGRGLKKHAPTQTTLGEHK